MSERFADGFELYRAAGVRVVPIEDFEESAVWVSSHQILLVDAGLTADERRDVACVYLPSMLARKAGR